MEHANEFFNEYLTNLSKGVFVARIGKVVKFYPEVMKVEVMPLPTKENAMVINVPMVTVRTGDFLIYYPPKPGDIVILLFLDGDNDDILVGIDNAQTERVHNVSDCVCLGGITLLNKKLDVDDKKALNIQNMTNTAKIVVKKDGDINIKCKHFKVEAERIDLNP